MTWTASAEQYLREHYAGTALPVLAERLGFTTVAIKSRANKLGVTRGLRQPWTVEEEQYVRDHYASEPTEDIAKHLGRKLGMVYQKAAKLGIEKTAEYFCDPTNRCGFKKGSTIGAPYRFAKDHVPANKGLRRPGWAPGRMRETQFKKGQRSGKASQNWKPVGTILTDAEGYQRIKVREAVYGEEATGFGNTDVWPLLNRYLWLQAGGPIPEGHLIIFKDGNRANCVIENLDCISKAENARRNVMWNNYPPELCKAIQLTGVLRRKINNATKQ